MVSHGQEQNHFALAHFLYTQNEKFPLHTSLFSMILTGAWILMYSGVHTMYRCKTPLITNTQCL